MNLKVSEGQLSNIQTAIEMNGLGKMYRLYRKPVDKILDAFGLSRFFYWRKDYYREFWALRDFNLHVRWGERLGIIGRNGAGKSTLLKIITGNISPTEGSVDVNGQIQALMELGTGFHPEFTGRQNIRASLSYQGFTATEVRNKEEEIIDFAEIDQFIDQPIKTYSAGMYARLAFSTATAVKPDILIIDEVLGAGDAYFTGKCLDRMRVLTEESGATVLFVSHDLGSVQQMCDRVIWIERGKVVQSGDPQKVIKAYYASVMDDEEVRLRARNAKLLQKHSRQDSIDNIEQEVQEVLFRLIVDNGDVPKLRHPVRRLSLTDGDSLTFTVEPGTPMDNDTSQAAHIIFDKRYMNWSNEVTFHGERVRCFEDVGGEYRHAPFVFSVFRSIWKTTRFYLEIEHDAKKGENVYVELYDGKQYRRLGKLLFSVDGWRTDSFLVINHEKKEELKLENNTTISIATQDKWQKEGVSFNSVQLIDAKRKSRKIFNFRESFHLEILVVSEFEIKKSWLAVTIYDEKGNCVFQKFFEIYDGIYKGETNVIVSIISPNLRQGSFVISVGLLSDYNPASLTQLPFYCLWNRCIEFRIDEGYTGNIPLGLIDLRCELVVESLGNAVFDSFSE